MLARKSECSCPTDPLPFDQLRTGFDRRSEGIAPLSRLSRTLLPPKGNPGSLDLLRGTFSWQLAMPVATETTGTKNSRSFSHSPAPSTSSGQALKVFGSGVPPRPLR